MQKKSDLVRSIFYCFVCVFVYSACDGIDPEPAPEPYIPGANGVFILNEGNWGQNDAGILFYNFETGKPTTDIMNGQLGDTGQDMLIYGSKLYVAVNVSSTITVIDLASYNNWKQIPVFDNEKPREPRYLTTYSGKVYATTYDGYVVRIDTAKLEIDGIAKVGDNPDGIVAVDGKLYIANSGGYNRVILGTPPDSTLSVVDIAQFKQTDIIKVGVNPYFVKADKYGNIYVTYRGDYQDPSVPSGIQKIDTKTHKVSDLPIAANQKFDIMDDLLYFYGVTYDANWKPSGSFGVYDIQKGALTSDPVVTDGTVIPSPYSIGVNPKTKDVYISDWEYPNKAKVYVFGQDGRKKNQLDAGIGANTFVFY
ncbi:MAG: hypothetical protein LBH19_02460 [Dysgonamonadaceae bacterium]|jgi:hypothetical protein|nr:hypothetical protein [Dysgonamonadaceae bacterium]